MKHFEKDFIQPRVGFQPQSNVSLHTKLVCTVEKAPWVSHIGLNSTVCNPRCQYRWRSFATAITLPSDVSTGELLITTHNTIYLRSTDFHSDYQIFTSNVPTWHIDTSLTSIHTRMRWSGKLLFREHSFTSKLKKKRIF